jgi:ABC-2 type transport system ATP-binding protein
MIQIASTPLSVTGAFLSYGQVSALNGLSLELHQGEILGLLGPNGAGKTSLINCISGRQSLDRGSIKINLAGKWCDIIGIVPQEIALYPDLTVLQNLQTFGRLHGLTASKLRNRIAEAVSWANLDEKVGALAKSLSGGMQRRLNIACSVLHHPQILLLDEPTVGVDPQSRERIYAMLDAMIAQGTSILLTTHHLEEAQTRCDRIAIIDSGKLLDCGTFDELLRRSIGTSQQLNLRFTKPPAWVPPPLQLVATTEATGLIEDASMQLPRLLDSLRDIGVSIEHLTLREPTLQHLFLHLTGKELRE